MSKRHKMRFSDALSMLDDDMPDGAYFAMAEELSGMDTCDGLDQMKRDQLKDKPHKCPKCNKRFATPNAAAMHEKMKHGQVPPTP